MVDALDLGGAGAFAGALVDGAMGFGFDAGLALARPADPLGTTFLSGAGLEFSSSVSTTVPSSLEGGFRLGGECTGGGEAETVLGIKIDWDFDKCTVKLSQRAHTEKFLEEFGFDPSVTSPKKTPLPLNVMAQLGRIQAGVLGKTNGITLNGVVLRTGCQLKLVLILQGP